MSIRLKLTFPLEKSFCVELWNFLAKQKCVLFYELAEPRELIKTFDRADNIDIDSMSNSTVGSLWNIIEATILTEQNVFRTATLHYLQV